MENEKECRKEGEEKLWVNLYCFVGKYLQLNHNVAHQSQLGLRLFQYIFKGICANERDFSPGAGIWGGKLWCFFSI
jgi:hypothetical protein